MAETTNGSGAIYVLFESLGDRKSSMTVAPRAAAASMQATENKSGAIAVL